MMNSRLLALVCLVLVALNVYPQSELPDNYPVRVLEENFNEQNTLWQYPTTYENLFVLENGSYYLTRQNPKSAYAIMAKWNNNLRYFNIETSVLLGPADSKEQSIGVMFLIQDEGKGAVVFEINKEKEFRVKKLVGAYYQFVSGDKNSSGWVREKNIDPKEYNKLEVRVSGTQCDFHINGDFVFSFDVPQEYGPGRMGIIIGPSAKAKVDYFYVGTNQHGADNLAAPEKIKTPEEIIAELRKENLDLKRQISDINIDQVKAHADLMIGMLEEKLAEANKNIELLEVEKQQLSKYKNEVLEDMDEDAYLTLSKSLKEEIKKNQALSKKNSELRDSIIAINEEFSELKLKLLNQAIKEKEAENKNKTKEQAKPETKPETKTEAKSEPEEKVAESEMSIKEKNDDKEALSVVNVLNSVKKLEDADKKSAGDNENWDTPEEAKMDSVNVKPKHPDEYIDQPSIEASKALARPAAVRVRKAIKQ